MPYDIKLSLSVDIMQHKVTCGSLGHSQQRVTLNMEVYKTSNIAHNDPLLFSDLGNLNILDDPGHLGIMIIFSCSYFLCFLEILNN